MSKLNLRSFMQNISPITIIGVIFICVAVLAAHSWRELDHAMLPMSVKASISKERGIIKSFESSQRISQEDYNINLSIENARQQLIDCANIKLLDLQWSLSTDFSR